jgi:hypothetical protein
MTEIPVVNDDGSFLADDQPLTKPYLGFYVKNRSTKQVEAYIEGLSDTCRVFSSVMQKAGRDNLTLEEFKFQLNEVLNGQHSLLDTMSRYVIKKKTDNCQHHDL